MESRLSRIEEKLERIDARLHAVDKHLAIYNEQLKVHIDGVNEARRQNYLTEKRIREDLNKVKNHVNFINRLGKLVSWAVGLAAATAAVYRLFF